VDAHDRKRSADNQLGYCQGGNGLHRDCDGVESFGVAVRGENATENKYFPV
jgi:hypothetical protein